MLSAWFVSCTAGSSFNLILPPNLALDARFDAIDILLPQNCVPPDPQRVVKMTIEHESNTTTDNDTININQNIVCQVSQRSINRTGSLMDRGANGSIAGDDFRIIER